MVAVATVVIAEALVWRQRFSLVSISVTSVLFTEVLVSFFWCSCTVSEVGNEWRN